MTSYSKNKKAFHDYEMVECTEAGISLYGTEVKSVRASNIQLKGSYVVIKDGMVKLVSCHISRPDHIGSHTKFDEMRDRPLLLHKKEIRKFHEKVKEKGFTLVVTEVYQPDNSKKIKVKLCLARGISDHNKRAALKEKDLDMETKRILKDY